jgi:hypothetical protein
MPKIIRHQLENQNNINKQKTTNNSCWLTQKLVRFTRFTLWLVQTTTVACLLKGKYLFSTGLDGVGEEHVMTRIGFESATKT